ncbi:arylesterase [Syntrophotalea carbinolica]|nr:arylesterase [Syntrophotalea carbinolica]
MNDAAPAAERFAMPTVRRIAPWSVALIGVALAMLAAGCRDRTPRLQPLPAQAVILAFGDSITAGNGAPGDASYPAKLQELTGWQTINAGVPGEISAEGARRLPGVLRRYHPDLVVLCHGGNDLLRRMASQTTVTHLATMIETIRHSGAQVVLLSVPRPGILPRPADFYQQVAEQYRVPLENEALTEILRDNALKSDLIHPNADGYRKLAEAVAAMLKRSGA